MQEERLKYKRLQIGHVWLRTVIEIILIIAAIVVCSILTVRSYENTFYEATKDSARESTQQLSHSVVGSIDTSLLDISEPDREAYIKQYYSNLFDECFIGGSILNSCALYKVSGSDVQFFASCDGFSTDMIDNTKLSDITAVISGGQQSSLSYDDAYYTYTPVFRDGESTPCALLIVSSQYMNSFDYNSLVMERLKTIAIFSGILIIVYYSVSGAVSAYKKRKAVSVG